METTLGIGLHLCEYRDLAPINFDADTAAQQEGVDDQPNLSLDPDELTLNAQEGSCDHLDPLSGNQYRIHGKVRAAVGQRPHRVQILQRHRGWLVPQYDEPAGAANTSNFLQLVQSRLNEYVAWKQGCFERGPAVLRAASHTMSRQIGVDILLP